MRYFYLLLLALSMLLSGCGDPNQAKFDEQLPLTEQRLAQLANALNKQDIRNARLIDSYADTLIAQKPNLAPIINEFRKDASSEGPMYQGLLQRLNEVKQQPDLFESSEARLNELQTIYQAADSAIFSDALSDPLNVLADMSDGELPRVNSLSKQQALAANGAEDFGVGSQLIGNPAYGQWQTNSSGMSFWEWYGMYALMSNLFGNDRVYYDRWGRKRGYSYYHDYGRSYYTSARKYRAQQQLETRTRKSFERRGQKFESTYAKPRTGSSGLSRQSKTAQQASKFRQTSSSKSKYASKSNYASNSSFRNSRSTTTRSFRRGK
ncbi:hypothetical protein [Thalassotalea maritima]|uniref:hypothetical protein n=1 Tax=Thalassotalea maritima TaxID=3242416 RepID=UPI003526C4CB